MEGVMLPLPVWITTIKGFNQTKWALPAGEGSGREDQIPKGEECYENDQDERRNAIHTPHA
jgi:hypothetical protein